MNIHICRLLSCPSTLQCNASWPLARTIYYMLFRVPRWELIFKSSSLLYDNQFALHLLGYTREGSRVDKTVTNARFLRSSGHLKGTTCIWHLFKPFIPILSASLTAGHLIASLTASRHVGSLSPCCATSYHSSNNPVVINSRKSPECEFNIHCKSPADSFSSCANKLLMNLRFVSTLRYALTLNPCDHLSPVPSSNAMTLPI